MADTSHDIRTLNSLIATTIDSIDGYTEAAKDSESSRFGQMFSRPKSPALAEIPKMTARRWPGPTVFFWISSRSSPARTTRR